MESKILKEKVAALLKHAQPSADILQDMTISEIDDVAKCLEEVGYKLIKSQLDRLEKALHYTIPGVKSLGHVPEDHPERQAVIDHINKLMTLPADHPYKTIATNVAKALHERHIGGDKVIMPEQAPAPAAQPQQSGVIDYAKLNQMPPKPDGRTLDYAALNAPKQPDPAATIDYSSGTPQVTVHKKP